MVIEEIEAAAVALPEADRLELIRRLEQSLHEQADEPPASPEAIERADQVRNGTAKLVDAEEMFTRLLEKRR
ncbi:MAG: hypothetical protein AAF561_03530 [Planctomycetota bacterium]